MPELNDEDNFPPVTYLEDDKNEEGHGYDDPPEYLSDDEYVSDTEYGISSQDYNQLGVKMLAVWWRYEPLLEHDYSMSGYIMYVYSKTYTHAKLSVVYIYVNYHVILLKFISIKII